ncbi:hypothetical protein QBC39DRAFT_247752 [Podospora conica]|nr:hypothetical protein QBC39DRAFT_247752 [Schizothecium conicum]
MVLPPYILHKPLPKSYPVPSSTTTKIFDTSVDYPASAPRTLVRRTADGALLLADPMTNDPALHALLFTSYPGRASLAVLNHENILSVHGDHATQLVGVTPPAAVVDPEDPTPSASRYLIHDWCDAGTVASLLADPPSRVTATGFLPESLVWHVALGVLRALRWLHEGVREVYGVEADPERRGRCRRVRGKTAGEEGWMPILHCAVRGENIFLAQPRGVETYGGVKLGNFGSCCVVRGEAVRVGVKAAGERRVGEIREGRGTWREVMIREGNDRPFYPGSDLFDLATILFHMTTGHPIPGVAGMYSAKGQECSLCGCNHLTFNSDREYVPCPHRCYQDINADTIMGKYTDYTVALQHLVADLLSCRWDDRVKASEMLDQAWEGFEHWASETPDGSLYHDIYDDIWWRMGNSEKKSWEDAAVEMATGRDLGTDEIIDM